MKKEKRKMKKENIAFLIFTFSLLIFTLLSCEQPFRAGLGAVVDTRPPTVALIDPSTGTPVYGIRTLTGYAEDDYIIDRVELMVTNYPIRSEETFRTERAREYLLSMTPVTLKKTTQNKATWFFELDTTVFPDGDLKIMLNAYDSVRSTPVEAGEYVLKVRNDLPKIVLRAPSVNEDEGGGDGVIKSKTRGAALNYGYGRGKDGTGTPLVLSTFEFAAKAPGRVRAPRTSLSGMISYAEKIYYGDRDGDKYPPQIRIWPISEEPDPTAAERQYRPGELPGGELDWEDFIVGENLTITDFEAGKYDFSRRFPNTASGFYGFEIRAKSADKRQVEFRYPRDFWPEIEEDYPGAWDDLSKANPADVDFIKENRYVLIFVDTADDPARVSFLDLQDIHNKNNAASLPNQTYDDIKDSGVTITDDIAHPYVNKTTVYKNSTFILRAQARHSKGIQSAVAFWESGISGERGVFIWEPADEKPPNYPNWPANVQNGTEFLIPANRSFTQWGYGEPKDSTAARNFIFTYYDPTGPDKAKNKIDASKENPLKGKSRIWKYNWAQVQAELNVENLSELAGLLDGDGDLSAMKGGWEPIDVLPEDTYAITVYAISKTGAAAQTSPRNVVLDTGEPTVTINSINFEYDQEDGPNSAFIVSGARVVNGVIRARYVFDDGRPQDSKERRATASSDPAGYFKDGSTYGYERRYLLVNSDIQMDKFIADNGGTKYWPPLPATDGTITIGTPGGITVFRHGPVFTDGALGDVFKFKTSSVYGDSAEDTLPDGTYWLYVFSRDNAFNVGHSVAEKIVVKEDTDTPEIILLGTNTATITEPGLVENSGGVWVEAATGGFFANGVNNGQPRNRFGTNTKLNLRLRDDDSLDLGVTGGDASKVEITIRGVGQDENGQLTPRATVSLTDAQVKATFLPQNVSGGVRQAVRRREGNIGQDFLVERLKTETAYAYLFADKGTGVSSLPDGVYEIAVKIADYAPAKLQLDNDPTGTSPQVKTANYATWVVVDTTPPVITVFDGTDVTLASSGTTVTVASTGGLQAGDKVKIGGETRTILAILTTTTFTVDTAVTVTEDTRVLQVTDEKQRPSGGPPISIKQTDIGKIKIEGTISDINGLVKFTKLSITRNSGTFEYPAKVAEANTNRTFTGNGDKYIADFVADVPIQDGDSGNITVTLEVTDRFGRSSTYVQRYKADTKAPTAKIKNRMETFTRRDLDASGTRLPGSFGGASTDKFTRLANGVVSFTISASDDVELKEVRYWLLPEGVTFGGWTHVGDNPGTVTTTTSEHGRYGYLLNGDWDLEDKKEIFINTVQLDNTSAGKEYTLYVMAEDAAGYYSTLEPDSQQTIYVLQSEDKPFFGRNALSGEVSSKGMRVSLTINDDDSFYADGSDTIRTGMVRMWLKTDDGIPVSGWDPNDDSTLTGTGSYGFLGPYTVPNSKLTLTNRQNIKLDIDLADIDHDGIKAELKKSGRVHYVIEATDSWYKAPSWHGKYINESGTVANNATYAASWREHYSFVLDASPPTISISVPTSGTIYGPSPSIMVTGQISDKYLKQNAAKYIIGIQLDSTSLYVTTPPAQSALVPFELTSVTESTVPSSPPAGLFEGDKLVSFTIPNFQNVINYVNPNLADGSHTLIFTVEDTSGQTGRAPVSFTKDTTGPNFSFGGSFNSYKRPLPQINGVDWWTAVGGASSWTDAVKTEYRTKRDALTVIKHDKSGAPSITGTFRDEYSTVDNATFQIGWDGVAPDQVIPASQIEVNGKSANWTVYLTSNGQSGGTVLPDGVHSIQLTVKDGLGNVLQQANWGTPTTVTTASNSTTVTVGSTSGLLVNDIVKIGDKTRVVASITDATNFEVNAAVTTTVGMQVSKLNNITSDGNWTPVTTVSTASTGSTSVTAAATSNLKVGDTVKLGTNIRNITAINADGTTFTVNADVTTTANMQVSIFSDNNALFGFRLVSDTPTATITTHPADPAVYGDRSRAATTTVFSISGTGSSSNLSDVLIRIRYTDQNLGRVFERSVQTPNTTLIPGDTNAASPLTWSFTPPTETLAWTLNIPRSYIQYAGNIAVGDGDANLMKTGNYQIMVIAKDAAGQLSEETASNTWNFVVDSDSPEFSFNNLQSESGNTAINSADLVPAYWVSGDNARRNLRNVIPADRAISMSVSDSNNLKDVQLQLARWNYSLATPAWQIYNFSTNLWVTGNATNAALAAAWQPQTLSSTGSPQFSLNWAFTRNDGTTPIANPMPDGYYSIRLRARDSSAAGGTEGWAAANDGHPATSHFAYFFIDTDSPALRNLDKQPTTVSTASTGTTVTVASTSSLQVGDTVEIGSETRTILTIPNATTFTVNPAVTTTVGMQVSVYNDSVLPISSRYKTNYQLAVMVKATDPNMFEKLDVTVERVNTGAGNLPTLVSITGQRSGSGIWTATANIPFIPREEVDGKGDAIDGLPDDMYRLTFTITDLAGKTNTVRRTIALDNSAPTSKINEPRAGEIKNGGEAFNITGETDDPSNNGSATGPKEIWYRIGYDKYDNVTTGQTLPALTGNPVTDSITIRNWAKNSSTALTFTGDDTGVNTAANTAFEAAAKKPASGTGSLWFKYAVSGANTGDFDVPTLFKDLTAVDVYRWALEGVPTAQGTAAREYAIGSVLMRSRTYSSGRYGTGANSQYLARPVSGRDGVYSLPLILRVVDNADNVSYQLRDILLYPNGDNPSTTFLNPSLRFKGYRGNTANGVTHTPSGGQVNIDGNASDNVSVRKVIYRVKVDNKTFATDAAQAAGAAPPDNGTAFTTTANGTNNDLQNNTRYFTYANHRLIVGDTVTVGGTNRYVLWVSGNNFKLSNTYTLNNPGSNVWNPGAGNISVTPSNIVTIPGATAVDWAVADSGMNAVWDDHPFFEETGSSLLSRTRWFFANLEDPDDTSTYWNFMLNEGSEISNLIPTRGFRAASGTGDNDMIRVWVEVIVFDGATSGGAYHLTSLGSSTDADTPRPNVREFYLTTAAPLVTNKLISAQGSTSPTLAYGDNATPAVSPSAENYIRGGSFAIQATLNGNGSNISQVSVRLRSETDAALRNWRNVYPTNAATGASLSWTTGTSVAQLTYTFSSTTAVTGQHRILNGDWAASGGRYYIDVRVTDSKSPSAEVNYTFEIGVDNFTPIADRQKNITPTKVAGTNVNFFGRAFDYQGVTNDPQQQQPEFKKISKITAWFTRGTIGGSDERYVNMNNGDTVTRANAGASTGATIASPTADITWNDNRVVSIENKASGTAATRYIPTAAGYFKDLTQENADITWSRTDDSGMDVYWSFVQDTTKLPDGWMTMHYVVYDHANNRSYYTQEMIVMNNYPKITRVTLYTNNTGEGAVFTTHDGNDAYSEYDIPDAGKDAVYDVGEYTYSDGYLNSEFISKNKLIGFGIDTVGTKAGVALNGGVSYQARYVERYLVPLTQANMQRIATAAATAANQNNISLDYYANGVTLNSSGVPTNPDNTPASLITSPSGALTGCVNLFTIARNDIVGGAPTWKALGVPTASTTLPPNGTHFVFQGISVASGDLYGADNNIYDKNFPTTYVWAYRQVLSKALPARTGAAANKVEPADLNFNGDADFSVTDAAKINEARATSIANAAPGAGNDAGTAYFLIKVWDTVNDRSTALQKDMLYDAVVVGMRVYLTDKDKPFARLYDLNPYTEIAVTGNNIGTDNQNATRDDAAAPTEVGYNIKRGSLYNVGTEQAPVKSGYVDPRDSSTALYPYVSYPNDPVNPYLSPRQERPNGFVTGDTVGTGTTNRDKVSGEILLRGLAWDDQLIDTISVSIAGTSKTILELWYMRPDGTRFGTSATPAQITEYNLTRKMMPAAVVPATNPATYVGGTWAYEEISWRTGHTVEWAYLWNTETEPTGRGNKGGPRDNFTVAVTVRDFNGRGTNGTDRLTSESVTVTQETANPPVASPWLRFHNSVNVDIVPYVTGFERDVRANAQPPHPTPLYATKRSRQGWYSFFRGEQNIAVNGYNLGTTALTMNMEYVSNGGPSTGTTTTTAMANPAYNTVLGRHRFDVPAAASSGRINITTGGTGGAAIYNHTSSHASRSWNRENSAYTAGSDLWNNKPHAHIWRTAQDTSTLPYTLIGGANSAALQTPGMALGYVSNDAVLHGAWAAYAKAGYYYSTNIRTTQQILRDNIQEPFSATDISVFNGLVNATVASDNENQPNVIVTDQSDGAPRVGINTRINNEAPSAISTAATGRPTQRWQNSRISKAAANNSNTAGNAGRAYMTSYDAYTKSLWFNTRYQANDGQRTIDGPTITNITNITASGLGVSTNAGLYSAVDYDNTGPIIAYYDQQNDTVRIAFGTASTTQNEGYVNSWSRRYLLPANHALRGGSGQYISIKVDRRNGIHLAFFNSTYNTVVYVYASSRAVLNVTDPPTPRNTMNYGTAGVYVCTVDNVVRGGQWTDISVDNRGNPMITYADSSRIGNFDGVRIAYLMHTRSGNNNGEANSGAYAQNALQFNETALRLYCPIPGMGSVDITGWEALSMPAAYTVNDDRLNIEVWPPSNRNNGGTGATPDNNTHGTNGTGSRNWSAAVGYGSDYFRVGYFFYPTWKGY